jgi:hypothetical protein
LEGAVSGKVHSRATEREIPSMTSASDHTPVMQQNGS